MAKNVDLTSQEWRDLVFAGKNKEFGAYQLRKTSERRHTMSMIWLLAGLVVVLFIIFGYSKYSDYKREQAEIAAKEKAEKMLQAQLQEAEEQPEEEQPEEQKFEQEIPQVPDEVLATVQVTQIAIVEEVKNEMLSMEEQLEDNTARGQVNQEGQDDPDKFKAVKENVQVVPEVKPEPIKEEPQKIFTAVEQPAEFKGGQAALMKWLNNNVRYPEAAQQNNVQGRVIVKFVVEKDGSVSSPQIVKGVDRDLDQEALRVVRKMPKWQAGKNNGQPVRSYFTLPVTFRLQNQ